MKGMKTSVATLAALGVAGLASNAKATTYVGISPPLDYASGQTYDIAVDSSTAQFVYRSDIAFPYKYASFSTVNSGEFNSASVSANPAAFDTTSSDYSSDPSGVGVAFALIFGPASGATGYLDLQFTNGDNQTEWGYASFDSGDLTGITTQGGDGVVTITAVPEPSTWALLIAGAGVVGVAARRQRRRSLAGSAA
jgi:hypothetical protein